MAWNIAIGRLNIITIRKKSLILSSFLIPQKKRLALANRENNKLKKTWIGLF